MKYFLIQTSNVLGPTFREQVQEWSVHQSEGYARWPQGWGMLSAHSPRCDWFELWVCGDGEGLQEKRRGVGGVGVGVGGWYDCKSWEEQRGTHRFVTDWTSLHQADAQLPILPKCCLLALPCADQVCIHTMFTMQAMHGQTVEDPSTQSRSFSLILFHQGPLLVSRGVGQIKYPFRDM